MNMRDEEVAARLNKSEIAALIKLLREMKLADKKSRETGCWCDEHGHPCEGCNLKRRLQEAEGRRDYLQMCLEGAANRIDDDTETINRQCKELGRLGALEEAARDLLDSMLEVTADAMGILPERKRLAEVLEAKPTQPTTIHTVD